MPTPAAPAQRMLNTSQGSVCAGFATRAPQVHRRSPSPIGRGNGLAPRSPQVTLGSDNHAPTRQARASIGNPSGEERMSVLGRGPQPCMRQNKQSLAHTTTGQTLPDRARVITSNDVDKVSLGPAALGVAALDTTGNDRCGSPFHCARMAASPEFGPDLHDPGSPYHCARLAEGDNFRMAQSSHQLGARARALPQGYDGGSTPATAAAAAAVAAAACAPLQFPSRTGFRSDLGCARSVSPQRRGPRSSSVCIGLGPHDDSAMRRPRASLRSGSVCVGAGGPLPGHQLGVDGTEQWSELRNTLGLGSVVPSTSRRSGSVCVGASPPGIAGMMQNQLGGLAGAEASSAGTRREATPPRRAGCVDTSLSDMQRTPVRAGSVVASARTPVSARLDFSQAEKELAHSMHARTPIAGELESVQEQAEPNMLRVDTPPPMGRPCDSTLSSFKLPDIGAAERLPLPAPIPAHGAPNTRRGGSAVALGVSPVAGAPTTQLGLSPGPPGCPTTVPPSAFAPSLCKTDVDNSQSGSIPSDTVSTVPTLGSNSNWQQDFMDSWFGEADAFSQPVTPTGDITMSPGLGDFESSFRVDHTPTSKLTMEESSLTIPVSWSQPRLQTLAA